MYFTNAANKRGRKTTLNFPKGHIAKQSKSRSRSEMPKLLSGRKKKKTSLQKKREVGLQPFVVFTTPGQ